MQANDNSSSKTEQNIASNPAKGMDPLLVSLIQFTQGYGPSSSPQIVLSVPVTLFMKGTVITGETIAEHEFVREYWKGFTSEADKQTHEDSVLNEALKKIMDFVFGQITRMSHQNMALPSHIHLKNIAVYQNGNLIAAKPGVVLRVSWDSIDGFSLGHAFPR